MKKLNGLSRREYNASFVELDTAEPYNTALLAYLNKRRRLY